MINIFNIFSKFSGLKPNTTKCEVAGIGSLKGVKMAVCGMKCVDLTIDTIKILGVHFSYNENLTKRKKIFNKYIKNSKCFKIMAH